MTTFDGHGWRTAALVLAAVLWAGSGLLTADLFAQGVDPIGLVAARTWIATAGLTAIWLVTSRAGSPRMDWELLTSYGVATAVASGLLFASLDRLPVAVALVLQNTAPVSAMLAAAFVVRRIDAPALAAVGVVLVAVALVGGWPDDRGAFDGFGLLLGLATGAGVALFSTLGARLTRAYGVLPASAAGTWWPAPCGCWSWP